MPSATPWQRIHLLDGGHAASRVIDAVLRQGNVMGRRRRAMAICEDAPMAGLEELAVLEWLRKGPKTGEQMVSRILLS